MATEQIIAQPTAKFTALSSEAREAGMEQITREPAAIPTLEDVIYGDIRMIGNTEIPEDTVQKALQQDEQALNFIRQRIDATSAMQAAQSRQVRIPGTGRDPQTGMLVPAAPEELEEPVAEELRQYGAGGIRLNQLLVGSGVQDARTRQLILDHFVRGEMLVDTGRQMMELPRLVGKIPNAAMWIGSYTSATREAALSENIDFETAWYNRQDGLKRFMSNYENLVRENIGATSFGQSLNETMKQKFIDTYGEEEYKRRYVFDPGIEGVEPIEGRIISDELGNSLLDFSFKELPADAQFGSFVLQNMPLTSGFGIRHLQKGKNMLKMVEEARKVNPALKAFDDATVYRQLKLDNSRNGLTRSWNSMTNRLGAKFNPSGAIGNVTQNRNSKNALNKLQKERTRVQEAIRNEKLSAGSPDRLRMLNGELSMLNGRINRLRFKGAGNPYMTNLLVDEGVIALGQTAGYNLGPQLGLDADTGGMLGALSFAFMGKPAIKYGFKGVVGTADLLTMGATSKVGIDLIRTIEDVTAVFPLVPNMQGIFINRQFDQVETLIGRPLTTKEATSFKAVADLMQNLDPKQREGVYNGMKNYTDLRSRIIDAFPEDKREEAGEMFTLAFGHVSGLAPLQAMENSSFAALRGSSFEEALAMQEAMEYNISQADFAVKRLREMLLESGVDTENSQVAFSFFDNVKKASDTMTVELADRKREYLGLLREYRNTVIRDPLADVDTDFVQRMADLEIKMTPGAVADIEKQKEIISGLTAEVQQGLRERLDNLKTLRGTPAHRRELARTLEVTYDNHMSAIYARGKAAYENANQALEGEVLDIGDFVQQFVDEVGRLEGEQLKGIFDPSRDFLNSRSGKLAYSAFNDMAGRSLRNAGLEEADVAELVAAMQNMPEYAGKNIRMIDVALYLRETTDINPFTANAFEADVVYRHFRNMGQRTADDAKARPYKEAASSLDSLIMGHPKIGPIMADTRSQYRSEVFDRKRPGSIGDNIDKSRTGPEFVDPAEGGLNYPYKKNMGPGEWHRDFVTNIGNAIDGKPFSEDAMLNNTDELARFWSDEFVDGKFVFDTTTQAGQDKLANLRAMLEADLYEAWGSKRLKDLQQGLQNNTGYDFNRIENMRRIQEDMTISVRNENGEIIDEPLVNLEKMLAEENDIASLVTKNERLQTELDQFGDAVNGRIADASDEIAVLTNLQKRDIKELEQLTIRDPERFFDTYVANGNVTEIQHLRQNFVASLTEQGVASDEATNRFNEGMLYMITNGFLKKGQVQASPTATFKSLTGETRTMETMLNPASLMEQIDNPNVVEILEDIGMDSEHIQYLSDISEFMFIAGGVSKTPYAPKGGVRPISANEIISRSFNLARGMVSPTYVAAEFAFRLMQQNNLSVYSLAASDKQAANIMLKMMEIPEDLTDQDIRTFTTLAKSFLIREGVRMSDTTDQPFTYETTFLPSDPMEAAKQEERKQGATQ
jgi:hypothetical protein